MHAHYDVKSTYCASSNFSYTKKGHNMMQMRERGGLPFTCTHDLTEEKKVSSITFVQADRTFIARILVYHNRSHMKYTWMIQ